MGTEGDGVLGVLLTLALLALAAWVGLLLRSLSRRDRAHEARVLARLHESGTRLRSRDAEAQ